MRDFLCVNGPLVSVIVPAYNSEKFLGLCLDSIIAQSYKNLEIVVVDDGSNDNTHAIACKFKEIDNRIILVTHEKNRGLFQSRITGINYAHGKYCMFVDSDDSISIDWIHALVKKAVCTNSDIVIGEFCQQCNDQDYRKCDIETIKYNNLDPFRIKDYCLQGQEAFDEFLKQGDSFYSWHVIWNKLYKANLWKDNIVTFEKLSLEKGRLVMFEDVAFSVCLWKHANKVTNTHDSYYFYRQHQNAATAQSSSHFKAYETIDDAAFVMKFFESQINKKDEIQEHYYKRWLATFTSIIYYSLGSSNRYEANIRRGLNFHEEFVKWEEVNYINSIITNLDENFKRLENIKFAIVEGRDVISFDVFDTLILRSYIWPTDLFYDLAKSYSNNLASYVDFARIRSHSETYCRKEIKNSKSEDITLDEIYNYIERHYEIPADTLEELKKKEIALELACSSPRKFGKELYELAIDCGKRIICTSDMYLPKCVVEKILKKNGYEGYEKLYLSSDIKLTKHTGKLYKHIVKELDVEPGAILHIGDNWEADYKSAKKNELNSFFLPNARDKYLRNISGYSGELYKNIYGFNGWIEDTHNLFSNTVSTRKILALSANYIFDNPFVSYNDNSDFNIDPRYIGYAALGPHILSVAKWVLENSKRVGAKTIHFVARDGMLIMKAFDLLNDSSISSNYIRVSRKALILADVTTEEDLYSLYNKMDVFKATPKKLYSYLLPIVKDEYKEEKVYDLLRREGINPSASFKEEKRFAKCLKVYISKIIDLSKLKNYKTKLKKHFEEIVKPGDYIFDIGYSGRVESALSSLLGYSIGAFYIHTNDDLATLRQEKYNCDCYTFYGIKPAITGVVREHLLMELGPSTIGFKENQGRFEPVFEEYEENYIRDLLTSVIQEQAIEYVKDYIKNVKAIGQDFKFNYYAASACLEYYLQFSKSRDRMIFKIMEFDDSINESQMYNIMDFWNDETRLHNLNYVKTDNLTAQKELERIYGSYTYKIGMAILWLPKKIRRIKERFI